MKNSLIFLIFFSIFIGYAQAQIDLPIREYNGITANFGQFRNNTGYTNHDGIDYQANEFTNVYPVCGGTATTGNDPDGWGKYVIVTSNKNGKTFQSRYAHLSKILVKTGDKVNPILVVNFPSKIIDI